MNRAGVEPLGPYTRARLRHIGAVTIVLSKQRRNDGPQQTKNLVTNLPDVRAWPIVELYRRRWSVEILIKELTGVTGLGQHQVTKDQQRVERSGAIAVVAYLTSVKCRAQDIPEQSARSLLTLTRHFAWQLYQGPLPRAAAQRLRRKELRQRKAA
jgi:hypothetical protein